MRDVDAVDVADRLDDLRRWPDEDEPTDVVARRAAAWTALAAAAYAVSRIVPASHDVASLAGLTALLAAAGGWPWLVLAGGRAVLWWRTRAYGGPT